MIACALLAVFVLQASLAARRDSVTIDEFVHLPVGLHALYTGDLSQDPINPPHTRMIAALPALIRPPAFDPQPGTAHWGLGYHLMQRNVERYHELFVSARAMIVLLASFLGILVYAWTREMHGWHAALVAVLLFAFTPELLAHGHLVTLDLAGALGFTATAYATWRMLRRPTYVAAGIVGVALGTASLLKLSGFVLIAVVLAGVAVRATVARRRRLDVAPLRWLALVAVSFALALIVINAGYLCTGTFASLGEATLDPNGALAALREAAPWLRLPLPIPFVNGIDMVLNVGKEHEPSYFLAGELSSDGWWYYHLAAFALKTPLPLLLLSLHALGCWASGRTRGEHEYAVLVPVILVFVSNSLFNSLQIGVRHVLPVYPLLFVAIAPRVVGVIACWRRPGRARLAALATTGLLVWLVAGTLAVAPRYLQYFNEVAGGPGGGHRWLIDSNMDWGQDLVRLREYMDREGIDAVHLAYFGRVSPTVYGIEYHPLERGRSRGIAVVSATFLMGRPYFWILGGRMRWVPGNTYAWLRELEPIDRVGALFVYRLP